MRGTITIKIIPPNKIKFMNTQFIKMNIYATINKEGDMVKQRSSGIKCPNCHSNKIEHEVKKITNFTEVTCVKCHYKNRADSFEK